MRVIYKYSFGPIWPGTHSINMPQGAEILRWGMQNGSLVCWAFVDTDNKVVAQSVLVKGTGEGFNSLECGLAYLSTVFDGEYVWHLFDAGRV